MSRDILLDFTFEINETIPLPDVDTSYLKNAVMVVKPKSADVPREITFCSAAPKIAELTDNKDAEQFLEGGADSLYILPAENLDLADILSSADAEFFTLLISSDFTPQEIAARNLGKFSGVTAATFSDVDAAAAFCAKNKQVGFFDAPENKAKNMAYVFGAFLSASSWNNCQFIEVPFSSKSVVPDLGTAKLLFNKAISFTLDSPKYGNRLAFFGAGETAVIAPYLHEEIEIKLQAEALDYIHTNKPQYTITRAKGLQRHLQKNVMDTYVEANLVEYARVAVTLAKKNFTANAKIDFPAPTALWRVLADLIQGEDENA